MRDLGLFHGMLLPLAYSSSEFALFLALPHVILKMMANPSTGLTIAALPRRMFLKMDEAFF